MDMKNDLRKSADPRKNNTNNMINFAKAMTPQEMQEAADYYASMKWTPWIKVQEVAQVPKMRSQAGMWLPLEGANAGMEPIGMRVIEMPDNVEQVEKMRSARTGFTAYVPVGSVAKGQPLVMNGDPARGIVACTVCHGGDLHGVAAGNSEHRGPFAELHGAAALRLPGGRPQRLDGCTHEADRHQHDERGLREHHGLSGFAACAGADADLQHGIELAVAEVLKLSSPARSKRVARAKSFRENDPRHGRRTIWT